MKHLHNANVFIVTKCLCFYYHAYTHLQLHSWYCKKSVFFLAQIFSLSVIIFKHSYGHRVSWIHIFIFRCTEGVGICHGFGINWKNAFLHDRPWISPWIKSISDGLDITVHVIASQLSGHCDVISNWLWRHQQNENSASQTRGRYVKIVVLSSFVDSLCRVRNKIIHVVSWRTVSVLTRVLF